MMKEIVANEGDVTKNDIILSKLKCFCSGKYSFVFPSLEQLTAGECPKIKIFSQGVLSTPRLWKV
ncbi:hypothetical protein ACOSP7_014952 [Xanthoceras sorbifolium]